MLCLLQAVRCLVVKAYKLCETGDYCYFQQWKVFRATIINLQSLGFHWKFRLYLNVITLIFIFTPHVAVSSYNISLQAHVTQYCFNNYSLSYLPIATIPTAILIPLQLIQQPISMYFLKNLQISS